VAIDIVFAEPDRASAENLLGLLPPTPGRALLEQEVAAQRSNDVLLAEAMAATPTVLGAILTDGEAATYPVKHGIAAAGDEPRLFLPKFSGAVVPLPGLSAAAAGVGALNWLPDHDQVVRRVPLLMALREQIVASIAVEALRVAQGASTIVVRASNA